MALCSLRISAWFMWFGLGGLWLFVCVCLPLDLFGVLQVVFVAFAFADCG